MINSGPQHDRRYPYVPCSISFGAACASGVAKGATILMDMGLSETDVLSTVRISFGKIHSLENVKTVVDAIYQILIQQNEAFIPHER